MLYYNEDVIRDSSGVESRIIHVEKVPRIDDRIAGSVFYLYTSFEEAEAGKSDGGSGFFVRIDSIEHPDECDLYAVTCKHVVQNGARFIRYQPKPERSLEPKTVLKKDTKWRLSEADDIAIAYLGRRVLSMMDVHSIPVFTLLTHTAIDYFDIGLGDDVYMVGRFLYHDGGFAAIRPSVRAGIISLMADPMDPILMNSKKGITQEAFLVEIRSIRGHSGSPVVWAYDPWNHYLVGQMPDGIFGRRRPPRDIEPQLIGPWVVGIECAVFDAEGVSAVIPSWLVFEMLNTLEEFTVARKKEDERSTEEAQKNPIQLTYEPQSVGVTKEEYLAGLKTG